LISIAVTTADPKQAATLANSIAQEYLRGQLLNQLAEERSATQRELAQLSSVYGARHPNYVLEQSKFEALQARLSALREEPPGEDAANLVPGQSFAPAEMVMVPSGPNAILILGITVGGALAAGIWLALFLRPHSAIPALGLTPYGGEQPSGSRIVTRSPDARPRRPANRGAIIVALIGWPLFFWSLASPFRQWAQEHTRLAAVEQQNQLLDGELKKERAAAGSLSDIEIRRTVAESGATAARQAAADAAQARREAEAEASHARDALAEAAAGREAAEKATSEAGAEHTRIAAEVDALARQAAWLNEQIAGRKSERAGVDKQVGDLRTTLASLAAAREQAAAAIEVAKTARDAIVAESAAAEKSADALKQQSAQLNADLAARKDDLAAIQDRLAKAQAEAAEQRDIEKKLVAARDQLKKVQDQNAREQQAARDASDQVAARNRDLADLENQLAQDREASNRVTAQRAEIERVVADSTARRDQLAADAERAQNAASDLQKRLTVLDDEATRRNRALAVLDAQLKSARTELEDVQSQIATARQNPPPVPPAAAAAETQAADSTRNGGVRE
jgi:chromosome segregation ATPase